MIAHTTTKQSHTKRIVELTDKKPYTRGFGLNRFSVSSKVFIAFAIFEITFILQYIPKDKKLIINIQRLAKKKVYCINMGFRHLIRGV